VITILVVAVPTEDACQYDVLLYEQFRAVITAEARRRYVRAHYYKDRMLLNAQSSEQDFERAALIAKREATKFTTMDKGQQTPALFHGTRGRLNSGYAQARMW
jgi:hypothetical protein